MITAGDFSNGTKIALSGSYATLKEIFEMVRNAEKKESGYIDLTSFSSLFGLNLEGDAHVTVLGTLNFIEKEHPVLWLAFDKEDPAVTETLKALRDGLSVKAYGEEEFNSRTGEEGKSFYAAPERRKPRPVVNYENKVARTEDFRVKEKLEEIRDRLSPDVLAAVDKEIETNGYDRIEDAVLRNFADALSFHPGKAYEYDSRIIDTMTLKAAVDDDKFGSMENLRKGLYGCDDLYIDGINSFYEKEIADREEEPER